uniref:Si:ch73-130a3.4 n=1 Tax=Amphilophus citrinellus TaxID=61819 RepID=A0A3Q0SL07_AMPCI
MPHSCAAWKCSNRFTVETRSHGITFHRFPKDKGLRKQWELATRRKGFSASPSSMLCSEHFRPEDFDRTGQSVRIRYGAVPSSSVLHKLRLRHIAELKTAVTEGQKKKLCKAVRFKGF